MSMFSYGRAGIAAFLVAALAFSALAAPAEARTRDRQNSNLQTQTIGCALYADRDGATAPLRLSPGYDAHLGQPFTARRAEASAFCRLKIWRKTKRPKHPFANLGDDSVRKSDRAAARIQRYGRGRTIRSAVCRCDVSAFNKRLAADSASPLERSRSLPENRKGCRFERDAGADGARTVLHIKRNARVYDFAKYDFDDAATNIKLGTGCRAKIYRHRYFEGLMETFGENSSFKARFTQPGPKISSAICLCRN